MAFYPGQLVVCVNAGHVPEATNNFPGILQKNHIYTVRDVVENPKFGFDGYGLFLESVKLPKCDATGIEEAWHPSRFNPCVHTNIRVFTSLLETVPAGQDLEFAAAADFNKYRVKASW